MEENTPIKKNNNTLIGLIFVIVIIVAIAGTTIYETKSKGSTSQAVEGISTPSQSSSSSNPNTPSTTSASNGSPSPAGSSNNSVYKDGTYSADGSYMTHVGQESIGVKITLKNDIIADVSVTEEAQDPESQEYQDAFAANYKQMVVGKNISSVHLDRVSTSSLTPIGFDNALQQIESQAKS